MADYGNARNYRAYNDDFDEESDDFQQPTLIQRPRANVSGARIVPPEYTRLAPAPRTIGGQGAPRQTSIPQPLPGLPPAGRRVTAPPPRNSANVPYGQTGAVRAVAPTLRPRQEAKPSLMPNINIGAGTLKMGLMIAGGVVALVVVYFLVSNVIHWWNTWQDDMTYGRPRTIQVDQFVGHGETDGTPSHFIVQNNNRQITVVEYPGGDVTKTRVIPGPRLFGKDMELAPVKPTFKDVNGDGHVDLVLTVDSQEIVYINENGNFRPITGEERAKYSKMTGGGK